MGAFHNYLRPGLPTNLTLHGTKRYWVEIRVSAFEQLLTNETNLNEGERIEKRYEGKPIPVAQLLRAARPQRQTRPRAPCPVGEGRSRLFNRHLHR